MKKYIAISLLSGSFAFAQGTPVAPAVAPAVGQAKAAGTATVQKAKTAVTTTGTETAATGKAMGTEAVNTGKGIGQDAVNTGKEMAKAKGGELTDKAEAKAEELTDKGAAKVGGGPVTGELNKGAKDGLKKGASVAKAKTGMTPAAPTPAK